MADIGTSNVSEPDLTPIGFRPRGIAPKPGFGPFLGKSNPVEELTGNSTSKVHDFLKKFTLNKLRPLAYSETFDLFIYAITLALITQKGNLYLYQYAIYGYHNKSIWSQSHPQEFERIHVWNLLSFASERRFG